MATKGFAYGMSAKVAQKIAGKRDDEEEKKVQDFIEGITGEKFDSALNYEENLRDGTRLLKLAKCLNPAGVKKINTQDTPFKKMENIEMFLTFCEKYGVPRTDLFQVANLYESSNISAVTAGIVALGRQGSGSQPFSTSEFVPRYHLLTKIRGFKVLGQTCSKYFKCGPRYTLCHLKPEWDSQSASFKNWPTLGPKPSVEHHRDFDEDTLNKGKHMIGIQAGTNKLASQAGQSFGGRRQIN